MKTLAEFIQRLRDDAAFEKQAQAFEHGDDLIAFVKREGYDFTLEQLMHELEPAEELPAETGGMAPAPADLSPPLPPGPDEAESTRKPEALSGGERGAGLLGSAKDDFTGKTPLDSLPQPQAAMPSPVPEEEPRAGLFRGGGGRHRGFCAQKLKSVSEEDS
jgi:predicted ribosomally synthesized peptide with nif11-like leader